MAPTLAEAITESQARMIDFTRKLIAIPTENPPGGEYRRCAECIAAELHQLGLPAELIAVPIQMQGAEAGYCVSSFYGEGQRTLYFHGHYDVVPHSAEGQFEPKIKGANLFGRGSSDMKSGVAAMIYAMAALRTSQTKLTGRVQLLIVPDEETGGARGSGWLSRAGKIGIDGIGMLTAEPTSGVVWNGNRGAISLRISPKGKAAHVGLSYQGTNAFERMLVIAAELLKLKNEIATRETKFNIHPAAARSSILLLGGECRGGSNFNVVPDSCSFTVDRRINPEEDLATERHRLLNILEKLHNEGVEHDVEIFQEGAASGVPEEHPFAKALSMAIESVTGARPQFELCPGLLENRFYAERGVPALAYGPGLLSVSHGPNEFVPLQRIAECALIYAQMAKDIVGD
jgi:acetylornithine deacetylase/succinyl-diaminopimelate desuccinylase family protein